MLRAVARVVALLSFAVMVGKAQTITQSSPLALTLESQSLQAADNIFHDHHVCAASTKIQPKLAEGYGRLPLNFEANKGQSDTRVRFLARGSGYMVFLTDDEVVLTLRKSPPATSRLGGVGLSEQADPFDARVGGWPGLVGELKSLWRLLIPDLGQQVHDASVGRGGTAGETESQLEQVMRMQLVGGNAKGRVVGLGELAGRSNYFIGNDAKKWRTNVPTYVKVRYRNVYPGIDLVYYGNQEGELEYDFVVAPYANADRIAFSITGLDGRIHPRENRSGDLIIPMGDRDVFLHKPRIYQGRSCLAGDSSFETSARASCRAIAGGGFTLLKRDTLEAQIGFELPAYDHSKFLIVDPVVSFSTFLGGNVTDIANGMALDSAGDIYLIGTTNSTNFPVSSSPVQNALAGGLDAFVTKLSGDGSRLIFSTYLGGSAAEYAHGITLDSFGNAYLTGETYSTDFPLVNPYQSQNRSGAGFVSKLSPDGSSLIFSTYLGGSLEGSCNGIAVDSNGEAVVAGRTYSVDFPGANAFQPSHSPDNGGEDAFVTKFSADGSSLIFSTYLGGNSNDMAQGITLDPSGNIYVGGITFSSNFPVTPGSYQSTYVPSTVNSFVSKFSPAGAIVYSTYLAGSQTYGIAVSTLGNAFVTGLAADVLPVTAGAFQTVQGGGSSPDAFVTEFDNTGSSLVYSTYLGGNNIDGGNAIAVDSASNAYVTGSTASLNFPLQVPVQSTMYAGVPVAFVSEFNSAGSQLVFSTYLGGGAVGYGSQQGNAIAVDGSGNIYAAGSTLDPDFPVVNAFQPTLNGAENAFVAKILNQPSPDISLSSTTVSFAPEVVGLTGPQQAITLTNSGNSTLTFTSILASGDFAETNTCGSSVAASASCTISVTFTPAAAGARSGTITITDNAPGSPQAITLIGTGTDFTVVPATGLQTTATVLAGQTATYNLAFSGTPEFTGTLALTCTGAPTLASCTIAPTSLSLNGTNAVNATVTVTTTSRSLSLPGRRAPPTRWLPHLPLVFTLLVIILALAAAFARRRKALVALAALLMIVAGWANCGGGGSGGPVGPPVQNGTPAGTYTLTVTGTYGSGSNALTHSINLNLTVN